MKHFYFLILFVSISVFFYLFLSLIGLIFSDSYIDIIRNPYWAILYSVMFSWSLPIFCLEDYYTKHELF